MKYRVHIYALVRVPVVVTAKNAREAVELATEEIGDELVRREGEYAGSIDSYVVDPVDSAGFTDYENVEQFEIKDGNLVEAELPRA